MTPVLGLGVTATTLRAVVADGDRILWAGTASYSGPEEIADAVDHLVAETPMRVRAVRVALERDVVQLRTVAPAPPLGDGAARRWVALEAPRLFRRNGAALVTDARRIRSGNGEPVLLAAAAAEPLVSAAVSACEDAGLAVEAVGPAAEVLPRALAGAPVEHEVALAGGAHYEVLSIAGGGVWRSRLVREASGAPPDLVPALAAAGGRAADLAAAYAVSLRRPALELLPPATRAARLSTARKRLGRIAAAALGVWLAAGLVHTARLAAVARSAERQLAAMAPALDSALALRSDLRAARVALETIRQAERGRSQVLAVLADLTRRLGDSVVVAAFDLGADSTVRVVGYAPHAAGVLAALESAGWLGGVRLETPATREGVGAGDVELDRFSVVARLEGVP